MSNFELKISDEKKIGYDHLVYLRVYEGCNLHCDHCFIPSNPKKMNGDDFEDVCNKLRIFASDGSKILIQWHGGEPTAIGYESFKNAIETIERTKGSLVLSHAIQTNLINYNKKWSYLFKKYFNSEIGVSWDYKIRKSKTKSGFSNESFESIFWPKIEELISDGIEPYLVVTGTKVFFEYFRNPFKFFDMMIEKNIKKIHIERITQTGYARDNWETIGLNNSEWSQNMSRFYRSYEIYRGKERFDRQEINISPFDGLKESVERLINGESGGYGCLSGVCDSKFHTIDSTGYKFGCTALNSEVDNKSESVSKYSKKDIIFFSGASIISEREARQFDCVSCKYKPICSSGCLAIKKTDGSGECSGSKSLFNVIYDLSVVN